MRYYTSQSTVYPPEWDKVSSRDTIYHNQNVRLIEATEDTPEMYAYDVDEYTVEEYAAYQDTRIEALEEQIEMLLTGVTSDE